MVCKLLTSAKTFSMAQIGSQQTMALIRLQLQMKKISQISLVCKFAGGAQLLCSLMSVNWP